ncbi:MAG: class I SAM-dependent methyltransferase [Chitinispirillaceae bacterium]|nr:class I SAM-dependent methyltransferase [Chitinispirillaceae bacterium]
MTKKIAAFIIRYVVSLLCCAYVHTAGALFRHGRKKIRAINAAFGFTLLDKNPDPPNLVPEVALADICPEDLQIRCLKPEFESGGIFPYEMICFNLIVAHYAPHRVFEIGTFNGRTTLNIAANTPSGTRIFTLDLPFEPGPQTSLRQHPWDGKFIATRGNGRYYRESAFRDKITQLNGDSATFDFTPYADTMDLVFIDGSHSYEYVTSDSQKALTLLRGGKGIILWHDYGTKWHDVTRALNDLKTSCPAFGSIKHIRGTSLAFGRFE